MKPFKLQKITPFLWFNDDAEQAAKHYVSIFKKSKILDVMRYPEGAPVPAGSVMTVTFQLEGQHFTALNGGPHFKLTEAVSLFVLCKDQKEIDTLWEKLGAGGEIQQCGWLKDKYGLSWQIVPEALHKMLKDKNAKRSGRVMQAVMQMRKLDIAELQKAYEGDAKPARTKPSRLKHRARGA